MNVQKRKIDVKKRTRYQSVWLLKAFYISNLVLLTDLIKLYIKAYLQKTFETKYIILINSCDVWLVEVICQLLRLQCGHCDSRKPCCTWMHLPVFVFHGRRTTSTNYLRGILWMNVHVRRIVDSWGNILRYWWPPHSNQGNFVFVKVLYV